MAIWDKILVKIGMKGAFLKHFTPSFMKLYWQICFSAKSAWISDPRVFPEWIKGANLLPAISTSRLNIQHGLPAPGDAFILSPVKHQIFISNVPSIRSSDNNKVLFCWLAKQPVGHSHLDCCIIICTPGKPKALQFNLSMNRLNN